MNVIKKLFTDLESLLNLLVDFDYSKLILLAIILSIIYLINNIILNKYYKPGINKTKIELKKINLEAAFSTGLYNRSRRHICRSASEHCIVDRRKILEHR